LEEVVVFAQFLALRFFQGEFVALVAQFAEFFVVSLQLDVFGEDFFHLFFEFVYEGILLLLLVAAEVDSGDVNVVEGSFLFGFLVRRFDLAALAEFGDECALLLEFAQPFLDALEFDFGLLLAELEVDLVAAEGMRFLEQALVLEHEVAAFQLEVVEVGDKLVLFAEEGQVLLLALLREEHVVGLELVVRGFKRILRLALARHFLLQLSQFLVRDCQLFVFLRYELLCLVQTAFQLLQLFEFLERNRFTLLSLACFLRKRYILFEQFLFLLLQLLECDFLFLDRLVERVGFVVCAGEFVTQLDVLDFLLAELGCELGLFVRVERVLTKASQLGVLCFGLRLVPRIAGDFLVARDILDEFAFGHLEGILVQVFSFKAFERHAELLERIALGGVEFEAVLVEECDQGG